MLLYLVSRPDIANSIRELSKLSDGANQAAFLDMHHLIKYIPDTRNLGLKLEPSGNEINPLYVLVTAAMLETQVAEEV